MRRIAGQQRGFLGSEVKSVKIYKCNGINMREECNINMRLAKP